MTPVLAFSAGNFVETAGAYAGFFAIIGLAVLSLLYFAQARELKRLRDWAGRGPERAQELEAAVLARPQPTPPPTLPPGLQGLPPRTAAGQAGFPTVPPLPPQLAPQGVAAPALASATRFAPPVPMATPLPRAPWHPTGVLPAAGAPLTPAGSGLPAGAAAPAPAGVGTPTGGGEPGQSTIVAPAVPGANGAPGAAPPLPPPAARAPAPPAPAGPTGPPLPPVASPASSSSSAPAAPAVPARAPSPPLPPPRTEPAPTEPAPRRPTRLPPIPAESQAPPSRPKAPRTLPPAAEPPVAPAREPVRITGQAAALRGASSAGPASRVASGRGLDPGSRRWTALVGAGVLLVIVLVVLLVTGAFSGSSSPSPAATPTAPATPTTTTETTPTKAPKPKSPAFSRADSSVFVLNGTFTSGLARDVLARLTKAGFGGGAGNAATATNQAQSATVIYYQAGHRRDALEVQKVLTSGSVQPVTANPAICNAQPPAKPCQADVTVVVGADQVR